MTARDEDSAGRLAWGMRRHFVLMIVIVIAALAASVWSRPPTQYRATALVTAYKLTMNPLQVPRLGQTVFTNGGVADAVIAHQHLGVKRDKVIPAMVSLAPVQDSIIFVVRGTDRIPAVAAQLANAAASAFVFQLNKPGAGVGEFGVQEAAAVPTTPLGSGRSLATSVLIGGGAGAVLALAVVALLLARRRPVIELAEAAALCEADGLGTLHLPEPGGRSAASRRARGIVPLVRILGAKPGATWTFVACGVGAETSAAERLRALVASQLAASGEMTVVEDASEKTDEAPAPKLPAGARREARRPLVANPRIVVRTGRRAAGSVDVLRGPGPDDRTVLVVCEGTSAAAVADVSSDFLPQDVTGVVLVQRPRLGKWARSGGRGIRSAPAGARPGSPIVRNLAVVPDQRPSAASVRTGTGR